MSLKDAILEVIRQRNGREITLQEIYREIILLPIVKARDKEPWKPGGQPRYQNYVRRRLTDLVREKLINRPGKGVYKSN